jgi:hypothetical protein
MKISLRFVVRKRGAASGWEDEAFRFLLLEDMTKTTSVQAIVGNLNVVDGRELGFLPVLIGAERHKLCGKCLGAIIPAANH